MDNNQKQFVFRPGCWQESTDTSAIWPPEILKRIGELVKAFPGDPAAHFYDVKYDIVDNPGVFKGMDANNNPIIEPTGTRMHFARVCAVSIETGLVVKRGSVRWDEPAKPYVLKGHYGTDAGLADWAQAPEKETP